MEWKISSTFIKYKNKKILQYSSNYLKYSMKFQIFTALLGLASVYGANSCTNCDKKLQNGVSVGSANPYAQSRSGSMASTISRQTYNLGDQQASAVMNGIYKDVKQFGTGAVSSSMTMSSGGSSSGSLKMATSSGNDQDFDKFAQIRQKIIRSTAGDGEGEGYGYSFGFQNRVSGQARGYDGDMDDRQSYTGTSQDMKIMRGAAMRNYNDGDADDMIYSNIRQQRSSESNAASVTNAYQRASKQVIQEASQNYMAPSGSFNSIFLRFPTCAELDKLIISADAAALLKAIQKISSDASVNCQQKLNYLMELLGRLRTAIQKKVRLADQLKIVIDSGMNEIKRLYSEIDVAKAGAEDLGLEKLKENQKKFNRQLEEGYRRLNEIEGQAPVLKAKVVGIQRQIQILTRDNEGQRSKIAGDKLQLTKINSEIGNIQSRLKQLQDRQAVLNDSIVKGQTKITQNSQNIKILHKKIEQAQIQMKKYRDGYDQANSQVKDLEVKVQRLRTDISVAESKKDRYARQISMLDDKIVQQKKKAIPDNLQKLNEMIVSLKELVPSVEKAIDTHYYNCYGAGSNVKVENVGNVTVYIVSADRFQDYIKNLYGQSVIGGAGVINGISNGDIALNKIDIFGSDWTGMYGYPFLENAFSSSDFSFAGSFSCLNPASTVRGWGTITNIASNFIEAKDEKGSNYRFNLGSCSRLESTFKVPKIGQKFYWSGVLGSKGYNLYSGSCFE